MLEETSQCFRTQVLPSLSWLHCTSRYGNSDGHTRNLVSGSVRLYSPLSEGSILKKRCGSCSCHLLFRGPWHKRRLGRRQDTLWCWFAGHSVPRRCRTCTSNIANLRWRKQLLKKKKKRKRKKMLVCSVWRDCMSLGTRYFFLYFATLLGHTNQFHLLIKEGS